MTKTGKAQTEKLALFREFEHTGDVGIELSAPTRVELFRSAVIALATLLVETAGIVATERREIVVTAQSDLDLMHDLLSELVVLFAMEGFIWRDAAVTEAAVTEAGRTLHVAIEGESFDPSRHALRGEIKAVTYHQLVVEESADGWHSRVIFDV